jgi:hypothetical protein
MWPDPRPLIYNSAVNTPKTILNNRRRCFPWYPCKVLIKQNSIEQSTDSTNQSSRGVEFRDASLPRYEFGSRGIECSRVLGTGSSRIMARKKLGFAKKTSCVI